MTGISCILFDCMETVVDIVKKPDIRLYCEWAYFGSGYESLWDSFDSFVDGYEKAVNYLKSKQQEYEEHNIIDRYRHMVRMIPVHLHETETVVNAIFENYWNNYKRNCIVHDSVKSTLYSLSDRFRLGIVSNFIVDDGVEELLDIHEISKFFDFVITSVKVGWRKPHENIYAAALDAAKASKEQILFVGDDYVCDYEGPLKYGFNAVLLDRESRFGSVNIRISGIEDLVNLLC
ncbi:MAG: HAD family hydrolase [Clostridiaceae bacterium]|mgnify:FL=1|nr:HAD family hydrolase [Clostridiaceae bacterium]